MRECICPFDAETAVSHPVRARALSLSLSLSFSHSSVQPRSVEFRWPHVVPPLVSFRPYVRPLPREFNVHAKQTAAPARLSIIRYIRPWPSNPSLTTPQTRREKEERTDKDGRRLLALPVPRGGSKTCGAPWRSRRAVSDDKEDRRRDGPGGSFRESFGIPAFPPPFAKDSPPFLRLPLRISARADPRSCD